MESSLLLEIDGAAEDVELRGRLGEGFDGVPSTLLIDLAVRFDDPVFLFDPDLRLARISEQGFLSDSLGELNDAVVREALDALSRDTLKLDLSAQDGADSYAVAPIYDAAGYQVGGLLVSPLEEAISAVLAVPREGYVGALWIVAAIALLVALVLGSYLTWIIVRPLRSISEGVVAIGSGEYDKRLRLDTDDEFGRLAAAVNGMAASVRDSISTLRQVDTLRREMVANMGHDLRTPLAAMLGYLEEARRLQGEGRQAQATEALETAMNQGKRLQQLVDDLFELSLMDSVPPNLKKEPVPVGELLHEVARLHEGRMREAGITFSVRIDEGLPVIEADGNRLLRMLTNLLSNAEAFTPRGGEVKLAGYVENECLTIAVADDGQGIAPESLEGIFERHARGGSARTRKDKGTGLGLAIGRAVARAHGGELAVESKQGTGARFTFTLPLKDTAYKVPAVNVRPGP